MGGDFFQQFWKDLLRLIEKISWSEIGGKDHPASDRYHITRKLLDQNYHPQIDKITVKWQIATESDLEQYLNWLDQQIDLARYWLNQDPDKFCFDTVTYRAYFENIESLKNEYL